MVIEIAPEIAGKYPPDYYQTWDLHLWIIYMIIGFIGTIYLYSLTKKSENTFQREYLSSLGFLLLFLTITRVFYTIGTLFESVGYDLYVQLGYLSSMIGIAFFFNYMEKSIIKRSHHIMTFSSLMGIVLALLGIFKVISRDIPRVSDAIISLAGVFAIVLIHVWLIFKTTGAIRKKAVITTIGMIILILGVSIDSEIVYSLVPNLSVLVSPILQIIGTLMILLVQKIE